MVNTTSPDLSLSSPLREILLVILSSGATPPGWHSFPTSCGRHRRLGGHELLFLSSINSARLDSGGEGDVAKLLNMICGGT